MLMPDRSFSSLDSITRRPKEKTVRYRKYLTALILTITISQPLFPQQNTGDGDDPPEETAETLFERARGSYALGEYAAAAKDFQLAGNLAFRTRDILLMSEIARALYSTRDARNGGDLSRLAEEAHGAVIDLAGHYYQDFDSATATRVPGVLRETGDTLVKMDLIEEALEALRLAKQLSPPGRLRQELAERIITVRRLLPLPPFGVPLGRVDQTEYRRRQERLRTQERLEKLVADVRKYPAAADLALADFVALTYVARSYTSQVLHVAALEPAAEHMQQLTRFVAPAVDVDVCNSMDLDSMAGLLAEIDRNLAPVVDRLSSVMRDWEADYLGVYANSSLDTSRPAEGRSAEAPPALRRFRRGVDDPVDEEELFDVRIQHLPLPAGAEISALYGDQGKTTGGSLTRQVRQALLIASEKRPRSRKTTEILEFDTRRMNVLSGGLLQVNLLQRAREHVQRWEALQGRVGDLGLRQCVDQLETEIRGLRVSNREAVLAQLQELRRDYLLAPADPMISAMQSWQRPSSEATWSETSQVLRWMTSELRVKLSIYRPSWCQIKQQAELEAELGIR